jgi:CheY-like chemotaxis protein
MWSSEPTLFPMDISKLKSRVLVVDDERVIADTLALILNQRGFETTAVYSGEQAVEAAVALQPHILISDIVMGKMSGIEAAILVAQSNPHCRILLFSGQPATAELLGRANAAGHFFEVLAKPVHPTVLLELLQSGHYPA